MMLFVAFVELLAKCILVMGMRRTVVTTAGLVFAHLILVIEYCLSLFIKTLQVTQVATKH